MLIAISQRQLDRIERKIIFNRDRYGRLRLLYTYMNQLLEYNLTQT